MHPIERLRFIARSGHASTALVVAEAAAALEATAADPRELLTACRRLIEWHPGSGPLVSLAANMISAADPADAARSATEAIRCDTTAHALDLILPPGVGAAVVGTGEIACTLPQAGADVENCNLLIVESEAISEFGALCLPGARRAVARVRERSKPVWLVAAAGTRLPGPMWTAVRDRARCVDHTTGPALAPPEALSMDLFDCVIGPQGPATPEDATETLDCPSVMELFR